MRTPMESYRDSLMRELADLESQLNEMAGFVGFMGALVPSAMTRESW